MKQYLKFSTKVNQISSHAIDGKIEAVALVEPELSKENQKIPSDEAIFIKISAGILNEIEFKHIKLSDFYVSINFLPTPNNLIAVKPLGLCFDILELKSSFLESKEMNSLVPETSPTIHMLNPFDFYIRGSQPILSFGVDGKLILYDNQSLSPKHALLTHSFLDGGISQAIYSEKHR